MGSGPQYYPGASRTYWHEDTYGGSAMDVNACVLHTTEGTSVPSYGGGSSAPNITALPDFEAKRLRWYQHFRIDTSSRALVNLRGGPETNTLNVVQVELVGTCDPSTHRQWGGREHIYWPNAPDWALRDLGEFLGWLHREHGVQLDAPSRWLPYPASYGDTAARMTAAEWRGFYGVCGHQHVVENQHGDPGAIDIDTVLAHARGEQEDDMPSAREVAEEVYDQLVNKDAFPVPKSWGANPKNGEWMWRSIVASDGDRLRRIETAVHELAARGAARDAVIAHLATGGGVEGAELTAAAEAGAERALAKLGKTLTNEGTT